MKNTVVSESDGNGTLIPANHVGAHLCFNHPTQISVI